MVAAFKFSFLYSKLKNRGPPHKEFCLAIEFVFVLKSKHCTTDTQIQYFENIFLMFSFFVLCTQWYCLIKKKIIFSLSSERLSALTIIEADLSLLRWCLGFAISFAVVLGFTDLRPISLSPNVARDGTDPSLSRWSFVGLWWPVVADSGVLLKLWLGFVVCQWVLQWVKMWLPVDVLLWLLVLLMNGG